MIKRLFGSHSHLAKKTALSRFVLDASSEEKRKVYNLVINQAVEEQRGLIELSAKRRIEKDQVAA